MTNLTEFKQLGEWDLPDAFSKMGRITKLGIIC